MALWFVMHEVKCVNDNYPTITISIYVSNIYHRYILPLNFITIMPKGQMVFGNLTKLSMLFIAL